MPLTSLELHQYSENLVFSLAYSAPEILEQLSILTLFGGLNNDSHRFIYLRIGFYSAFLKRMRRYGHIGEGINLSLWVDFDV